MSARRRQLLKAQRVKDTSYAAWFQPTTSTTQHTTGALKMREWKMHEWKMWEWKKRE